jgi:hypothetical protein
MFNARLLRSGQFLFVILLASLTSLGQRVTPMTVVLRQAYLTKLLEILPPDPPFDAWLKKTNALPPDFNSLPRQTRRLIR